MKRIEAAITHHTTIIATGLTSVLFIITLWPQILQENPCPNYEWINFQLAFCSDNLQKIFNSWGPMVIQGLKRPLFISYGFTLTSTLFLSGVNLRLRFQKQTMASAVQTGVWICILVLGFLETTLQLWILSHTADLSETLIFISSLCSAVRWTFLLSSLAVIALQAAKQLFPTPS